MRRKDELSLLVRPRRIQEQPDEFLRELGMERVFKFVNQVHPRPLFRSRPIQDGEQMQVANTPVRFLFERKPELIASARVYGYEALVYNISLRAQPSAKDGPVFRIQVHLGPVVGELALDLIEDFVFRGHLGSRHNGEADVGNTGVGDCEPLPNCGTKILVMRDLLRHEDITRSAPNNRQTLEPCDHGSE